MQFVTVYHDHVSVRKGAEIANVSCLEHKTNSASGLPNIVTGLGEFFKTSERSWNKISWNSFLIPALEWDQHLPFKQISAMQSQDCIPMSVSTGSSENEAYSSLSFLDTWNLSLLRPLLNVVISVKIILKWNERWNSMKMQYHYLCSYLIYNKYNSIIECILKYNFVCNFMFCFSSLLFKNKQSVSLLIFWETRARFEWAKMEKE